MPKISRGDRVWGVLGISLDCRGQALEAHIGTLRHILGGLGEWTSIVVSGPSHPEWKLASRHGLGYLVGKSHIFVMICDDQSRQNNNGLCHLVAYCNNWEYCLLLVESFCMAHSNIFNNNQLSPRKLRQAPSTARFRACEKSSEHYLESRTDFESSKEASKHRQNLKFQLCLLLFRCGLTVEQRNVTMSTVEFAATRERLLWERTCLRCSK